jgi:hypothetical protein
MEFLLLRFPDDSTAQMGADQGEGSPVPIFPLHQHPGNPSVLKVVGPFLREITQEDLHRRSGSFATSEIAINSVKDTTESKCTQGGEEPLKNVSA